MAYVLNAADVTKWYVALNNARSKHGLPALTIPSVLNTNATNKVVSEVKTELDNVLTSKPYIKAIIGTVTVNNIGVGQLVAQATKGRIEGYISQIQGICTNNANNANNSNYSSNYCSNNTNYRQDSGCSLNSNNSDNNNCGTLDTCGDKGEYGDNRNCSNNSDRNDYPCSDKSNYSARSCVHNADRADKTADNTNKGDFEEIAVRS